jgi:hypothetical protein
MSPPGLGDVFFKAIVLAQQSGASEINIDILFAALDAVEVYPASYCLRISTESGCYAFSLNNSDWTPVSTGAAKALRPFDGVENVDPATVRKALAAAKEK